jgi:hypothetical protein
MTDSGMAPLNRLPPALPDRIPLPRHRDRFTKPNMLEAFIDDLCKRRLKTYGAPLEDIRDHFKRN